MYPAPEPWTMPSIGGRPSPGDFEERRPDESEDSPPVGFATDRLSKLALWGAFPVLWLARSGEVPAWLAAAFGGFYLPVVASALSHDRPLAALGWALFLPALAFATALVPPSAGFFVAGPLVLLGLCTVAYADHRYRRQRDEATR
jgi:hypothetical protein